MHKREVVLSVLRYSQRRSVATATKRKPAPESWDTAEPILPPAPDFSKWARPNPQSNTQRSRGSTSSSTFRSASPSGRGTHPSNNGPSSVMRDSKWGRSEPHSSQGGARPFRSVGGSSDNGFQRDSAPHEGRKPFKNDIPLLRHISEQGSRPVKSESPSTRSTPRIPDRSLSQHSASGNSNSPDVHGSRTNRNTRNNFKDRGSLVHSRSDDISIPSHPRVHNDKAKPVSKEKKIKVKHARKVAVDLFIPSTVSVGQLARLLNVRQATLVRKMMEAGMEAEASHDHVLTSDYAALLAGEFGRNPVINDEAAYDIYPRSPHPDPSTLPARPPIITIMGHVDHGKTTLLDTLRSASVAKGEAGGITQHIGAFSVPVSSSTSPKNDSRIITFLDTPGHAAFSAMRARGAGVTDIVVLVVAADDGVMPQTKEVIDLIKKDNVSVVVAINKVDKPEADVKKVQHALLAEGVQLEAFGGDVPCVEVSALTGQGLDDLVEILSTIAEVQDLRAERDGQGYGCVLESRVQKGLGPVATVLVLRGCITPGSHLIAGAAGAKVRVMNDSTGSTVKAAYPGMAVTVSGWKDLPSAGDEVLQGIEAEVKKALTNRLRKAEIESTLVDLEAINAHRMQERIRRTGEEDEGNDSNGSAQKSEEQAAIELRLVVKGDVSGSVEALVGALEGIGNKHARVKIVATGVGDVMESDVMMAKASEGTIIAFSVNVPRSVESMAAQNHIPLYSSKIIYRVMDEVRNRLTALLPSTIEKKVTGEAIVLQLFDIHLKGKQKKTIAGCRVGNGLIEVSRLARVIRNGEVLHEGPLEALKQQKKDVSEVKKGSECGISLETFQDLREADLIQTYEELKIPGVL